MLNRVRNAEKLPGVSEIILPGEREATLAKSRIESGTLPLEKNMLAELRALAAKFTEGEALATSSPALTLSLTLTLPLALALTLTLTLTLALAFALTQARPRRPRAAVHGGTRRRLRRRARNS